MINDRHVELSCRVTATSKTRIFIGFTLLALNYSIQINKLRIGSVTIICYGAKFNKFHKTNHRNSVRNIQLDKNT